MAGHQKEKAIADEVHQNQILRELYLKELRTQKLYTQYHVNPLRKVHTIARKPMSWHDNLEEPADARFLNLIHHAAQGPRKKYPETQTEGQEIGWDSEPLGLARKSTRGHTSGDWDLSQVQVPTRQGLPPSPQASF
ncbi:cilia- and flagella-associated protein 144 isoform X2 [Bos indicus]|uniref:Cilia and flagella associated protein 144 n=2 Tax=Bos TaxID=9903 RepID=A0AAF6ZBB9_BOVIN|nr:protein FAM183A isoform X2 [Bubalus bubalis]XP_010802022.1 cilia- and flagella-associated protein 144 isoform X2 [Bos taurus]XP_019813244.1 PREDICTED: protein FAM183A isoform X2 [Bos indicus]XP_027393354.1 protein FAM183A isoform X2 [Bos indicus x Bos taurus]XP_061268247.1 cilia- and flagella-associated protein 144 isoform X2 [Bos javanicus]